MFFSPVRLEVFRGAVPVSGAVVAQAAKSNWYGQIADRKSITDESGIVELPGVTRSALSLLPHQPAVHQEISILHDGGRLTVWRYVKMDYKMGTELNDWRSVEFPKGTFAKNVDGRVVIRVDLDLVVLHAP